MAILCRAAKNSLRGTSSKYHISLFDGEPARGLPTPPPHLSASRYHTFSTCWMASGNRKCEINLQESLAGGEGGGWGDLQNSAIQ